METSEKSLSLRGLEAQLRQAEVFIESGLLPAYIKKPATVVAIVQRGSELGIPPMEALSTLYAVHGKICCDGKTMLALAWRSGKLATFTVLESTDAICRIRAQRVGCEAQEFSYTIQEAERLGLTKPTQAHPEKGAQYRSQPGIMLLWKATGRILRIVAPDALAGMYTYDEMNLPVREEDGNLVLDGKGIVQAEQHDELKNQLGAAFEKTDQRGEAFDGDASGQVGPTSDATAPSAPVCPKCSKTDLWDNTERWQAEHDEFLAGNRARLPRARFTCRNKECGGAIWDASDMELYRRRKHLKKAVDGLGWNAAKGIEFLAQWRVNRISMLNLAQCDEAIAQIESQTKGDE